MHDVTSPPAVTAQPRLKVYFGKVCAKHPELEGERQASSRDCIGCARVRHRAYREKNKEKMAERQRAHYEKNREKIAERRRAYREKNKEKMTERERAYYEKNREKFAEYQRAYHSNMTPEQREIYLAKTRAYKLERAHNA